MPTTTPDLNGCEECGLADCPSLLDVCPSGGPDCLMCAIGKCDATACKGPRVDWRALYFAAIAPARDGVLVDRLVRVAENLTDTIRSSGALATLGAAIEAVRAALRQHATPLVTVADPLADYLASRGEGRAIWNTPEAREYIDGLRDDTTPATVAAPLDQVRDPHDWHDFDGVCPECHSTMPGFHRANCAERLIEATVAAPAVRVEGVLEALRMDRTILEVHVASGEHGLDPGSRVAVTPLPDPHKGDRQG